jgi:hypothetical protein
LASSDLAASVGKCRVSLGRRLIGDVILEQL